MSLSLIRSLCVQQSVTRHILNGIKSESCLKINKLVYNKLQKRALSLSALRLQESTEIDEDKRADDDKTPAKTIDPSKDRSVPIPVDVGIKYLESDAYKEAYGDIPVWRLYKRNHRYAFPPLKLRKTCIKNNVVTAGNPCPICRDEYLVLDYRNVKLLRQFISPYSDEVIHNYYTGVCEVQHFKLLVAIEKAKDYGYLEFFVPKRVYNYDDYYPQTEESKQPSQ